ncbi:hypothetical protein GYU96_07950 [Lactobacillus mellis]|uniref:hypothetical protein n=1 Tax=Bombilactobacillus mellis TaxID=1218508 RepID=UPI0015809687|nr:hypothetical protein [Bombilactobacillus mellis]NUG67785.1 hypothetical protein [Bombilactobacillus mellis]
MLYKDEKDFLIKNIKLGKSANELVDMSFDYGLDGDKIYRIINNLLYNELITMFNTGLTNDVSDAVIHIWTSDDKLFDAINKYRE